MRSHAVVRLAHEHWSGDGHGPTLGDLASVPGGLQHVWLWPEWLAICLHGMRSPADISYQRHAGCSSMVVQRAMQSRIHVMQTVDSHLY